MCMIRRIRPFWKAFVIFGLTTPALADSPSSPSPGKSPPYRILQQVDTKPLIAAKPVQPYAYGWFGAKTSMHWHRQVGNRRTYTQLTLK